MEQTASVGTLRIVKFCLVGNILTTAHHGTALGPIWFE